jgi:hypothetical protein
LKLWQCQPKEQEQESHLTGEGRSEKN